MNPATREILRGLAGGVGFVTAWLLLSMPWWLAALLGLGLYVGASLIFPASASSRESPSIAPGLTAEDHREFVAKCAATSGDLRGIAARLPPGPFRSRVASLAETARRLADYFQRKPESMVIALELPLNLEQLVKMLRQYAELGNCDLVPSGATVKDALTKVEETVSNAALAFDGVYRQLVDNDLAALKASAASLQYLLGVQPELERDRRLQQHAAFLSANLDAAANTSPNTEASAPAATRQRRRQMDQPL